MESVSIGPRLPAVIFVGWAVVVFIQAICNPGVGSAVGGCASVSCALIAAVYMSRAQVIRSAPVSSLMILGFVAYYFILPPIATVVEAKELTTNITNPLDVYANAVACFVVLLLAHLIYRRSRAARGIRKVTTGVLDKCRYFAEVDPRQLFIMGGLGLLCLVQQLFLVGSASRLGDAVVGDKLLQAFYPLAYLPYCLLLPSAIRLPNSYDFKRWRWALTAYTLTLFLLSIASNSRSTLFVGAASVAIAYMALAGSRMLLVSARAARRILISVICMVMILPTIADFAISMVIVRAQRVQLSAVDLISETLSAFNDKERIEYYREVESKIVGNWDERYVDNPLFARLANLKYADASLTLARDQSESTRHALAGLELQKALSVLPEPLIDIMGLPVNKATISGASGGDLMLLTASNDAEALGGARTGSLFGSGIAIFGNFYFLVLFVVALFTFPLADAQVRQRLFLSGAKLQFNPLALVSVYSMAFYFTSAPTGVESFAGFTQFPFRGWIQQFVIFALAWSGSRLLMRIFRINK